MKFYDEYNCIADPRGKNSYENFVYAFGINVNLDF